MATTVGQHSVATFSSPVNGATPIDANTVRGNDNTIRSSYNDHDADTGVHVQSSTLASRPAAGTAGRKWITSGDGGDYHLWFDDGSKWVLVGDQTTQVQVRAAASLTAGQVVKLTGYNTTDKVPEVNVVASAADTAFGLVEVAISSGAIGYVTVMGVVTGVVNTSSFSALDQLYQNGSAGFTATKPTSGVYQPCAVVLRSDASAGSVYVEFMATRIVERTDNTANTIVLRDGSGAFTTGAITSEGLITFASLKGTGSTTVTNVLDEDNMASDSATALATQQSIKAYVDTKVTAEDLDFAGDSGSGSVDLDSQTFTVAGTSNEIETSASGQTLTIGLPDDVTIGDDLTLGSDGAVLGFGAGTDVTLTHVHDTGLLLNGTMQLQFNDASQNITAPSATVLDINATDEIELNATAVDLNGTLDVSGAATLATSLNIASDGATVTGIKDEDDMASNSAVKLATQQSIKAYVDAQITAEDLDFAGDSGSGSVDLDSQTFTIAGTSNEVETSGSGQTLTVGLPSNVTIGNNLTVTNDLDVDGTTNLDAVDVDGAVQIDSTVTVGVDDTGYDVKFFGATSGAYMLWDESADDLVLAGAAGLDVAGDIDVDGTTNLDVVDIDGAVDMASTLTVAGNVDFNGDLDVDGTTNLDVVDIDGAVQIDSTVTVGVDDTGYDVKFFGATSGAYMLWDESTDDLVLAGAAKLGVGTTSPEELLEVASTNTNEGIQVSCYSATQSSAGTIRLAHSLDGTIGSHAAVTVNDQLGRIFFAGSDGTDFYSGAAIIADSTQNYTASNGGTRLEFYTTPNNSQSRAQAVTIDQDGSVGIGTSSPDTLLHVDGGTDISMSSSADGQIKIGGNAYNGAIALDGSNMSIYHNSSGRGLVLGTNETARLTIAGGGDVTIAEDLFCSSNVGIGTTSPGTLLELKESSTAAADAVIRLRGDGNNADNTVLGALEWYNADSSGDQPGVVCRIEGVSGNSNGHMGELVFKTHDGSESGGEGSNPVERMRIDSSGNVGINTSSPQTKLDLGEHGGANSQLSWHANSTTSYGNFWTSTSGARPTIGHGVMGSDTVGNGFEYSTSNTWGRSAIEVGYSEINFYANAADAGTYGNAVTMTNQMTVDTSGVTIAGALSKGSGSFKIDHPLPEMSDTHHLVHSFVEGPKADLIYRGSVSLVDGAATVDLDAAATMTSGTWEVLCRDPQVWVQNEDGWTQVRGSISGSTLSIEAQDADCTDTVSWLVVAERKDPNIVGANWTDEEGRVIVEPLKTVEPPKSVEE